MTELSDSVNLILAILTVAGQVAVVALAALLAASPSAALGRLAGKYGLLAAFSVAVVSTAFSLVYSEIIGFEPCKLCWLQRIFMYPQVVTLGLALAGRNRDWVPQTLLLSAIGAVIAISHVTLQYTGISFIPCDAVGQSVSCSKEFVKMFGYITIPMMSVTGFLMIIGFTLHARRHAPAS